MTNTLALRNRTYLFVIPVLIFLYINFPLINSCLRGEHWMLLYRYVEHVPLGTKLENIALFAFPGIQRPQFLAFFVPYIPFVLFGVNFTGYFLFSALLHIVTGALIVQILASLGVGIYNRFWAFSLFVLSYVSVDVVNWTFFSYVQLSAILILASTYWLMQYLTTKKPLYFYLQNTCIFIACYLYEINISVFLVQLLLFIPFRIEKKYIGISCLYVIATIGVVLMVFGGLPNESDAEKVIHLGIIYRSLIFIKNLLLSTAGLYPLDFEITNLVFLKNVLTQPVINGVNILIVGLAIILLPVIEYRSLLRSLLDDTRRFFVLLNGAVLGAYVVGLCYARVPLDAAFEANTYLDSQPRYYYLPTAIIVLLFFSLPMPAVKWKNVLVSLLLVVMIAGNCLNSVRLVDALRPYYRDSLHTVEVTHSVMRSQSIPYSVENFIKIYVYAWLNQIFPSQQRSELTADFIYNTDDMWLEVLPEEYDAKVNRDLTLLLK